MLLSRQGYTLNADRFSVEEIKNVASHGVSRMARLLP
jgi:hypothetical protein